MTITPYIECPTCHGFGVLSADAHDRARGIGPACTACEGEGLIHTLARPAVDERCPRCHDYLRDCICDECVTCGALVAAGTLSDDEQCEDCED